MSVMRCSDIWIAGPRTSLAIACSCEASRPAGHSFSGDGVSSVVKHALKRAHIDAPAKGAHLLRHTAATEMLRNGVPLDQAGLVLRHRSIDMTAYYAKADVALLKQIAQPWPEVKR
jgi:site-specific recombinase XerD